MSDTPNGSGETESDTTQSSEHTERPGSSPGIPFVEAADLRDYFAAHALVGHISKQSTYELYAAQVRAAEERGQSIAQFVAQMSYECADAMLKAREAKDV